VVYYWVEVGFGYFGDGFDVVGVFCDECDDGW